MFRVSTTKESHCTGSLGSSYSHSIKETTGRGAREEGNNVLTLYL